VQRPTRASATYLQRGNGKVSVCGCLGGWLGGDGNRRCCTKRECGDQCQAGSDCHGIGPFASVLQIGR